MKKPMKTSAAFLAAGLLLYPVFAYAQEGIEEETSAEETQEGKSGWMAGLQGFLEENGDTISGLLDGDNTIPGNLPGDLGSLLGGDAGSLLGGLGSLLGGGESGGLLEGFGSLLEGLGGLLSGETDFGDLDALIAQTAEVRKAESAYMLEVNASLLEPGDLQIIVNGPVYESLIENGAADNLSCFIQQNFTRDDDAKVLRLLCEKTDVVRMTLQEQEDGSFIVADAAFAEEGEGYEASLEELIAGMERISLETCLDNIDFTVIYYLPDTLADYLDDHPEIAGIEFDGEIRTAEELRAIRDEQMKAYEDPEAEDASAPEE